MKREQKTQIIEEYMTIFDKPGIYLMDFTGLNVAEMTELRRKLREADVSIRVVKNTLAKRAIKDTGITEFDASFVGPIGVVWSAEGPVVPARVLVDFINGHKKGVLRGGLVDGNMVDKAQIEVISKLPTKKELQARLASVLNAPIVKLARVLNAVPTKFVRTLVALKESRGDE